MTHQQQLTLKTRGHGDMHDLTARVNDVVRQAGMKVN